jgi:single-strand binding protein
MARCKNRISLIGTVGKDVEARQTQQGLWYARISLATSTGGYKKKDGTDVPEVTQWHSVCAWRANAQYAGQYVKKGMRIAVDGMLTYNKYTDKQGVERISAEIIAEDLYVFNSKQNTQQPVEAQAQPIQSQPTQVNNHQQQGAPFPPPTDDDLPF